MHLSTHNEVLRPPLNYVGTCIQSTCSSLQRCNLPSSALSSIKTFIDDIFWSILTPLPMPPWYINLMLRFLWPLRTVSYPRLLRWHTEHHPWIVRRWKLHVVALAQGQRNQYPLQYIFTISSRIRQRNYSYIILYSCLYGV